MVTYYTPLNHCLIIAVNKISLVYSLIVKGAVNPVFFFFFFFFFLHIIVAIQLNKKFSIFYDAFMHTF